MSCYSLHSDRISSNFDADLPCGIPNSTYPHVQCCVKGDYCMSNGICHYYKNNSDQGYYTADCTDPTLQDSACMTRCGAQPGSIIAYDENTGLWACCTYTSDGKSNCSNLSDEKFPAPAPSKLVTMQYLPPTGTPEYATPTDVMSTPLVNSTSNQIGAGAAAGIGVGVGVGVFLLATTAAFFYIRRRRSSQHNVAASKTWTESVSAVQQPQTVVRYELGKPEPRPQELA
ncbi:hypothetical protein BDV38DRAFT_237302 [Aspergillus pseudotamarii]|uniref:Mid2 domain-containing protein n=1 Tax=Aspergillus pseudotamarii TaxID=132259 RepID=A0A5N6T5S0_ASPPS|nr:uncharacterized protein BDV38DRAFT_237302 [Aspergillus pseudotamarii]KAE8141667.1 hypothetical protein BDV38DRAFT_237302 [Aspergillus pseudotamarii]